MGALLSHSPQLVCEVFSCVIIVPALLPQMCLVTVGLGLLLAPVYVSVSSSCFPVYSLAMHTFNREVLELVIFLKLRRGLYGGGGRLPVRYVADDSFCGRGPSLCSARHIYGICEVWCAVPW